MKAFTLLLAAAAVLPMSGATPLKLMRVAQNNGSSDVVLSVDDIAQITFEDKALTDYPAMYLANVDNDQALAADIFGVPMITEKTGVGTYEARYYNTVANQPIYFIPSRTSFSPCTYGRGTAEGTLAQTAGVADAMPITLPDTGVYYKILLDVNDMTYSMSTYTPQEALDPMPLEYGSHSFEVWGPGSDWIIDFEVGVLHSTPPTVQKFAQDSTNPHLFTVDMVVPESDLKDGAYQFKIHNYHPDQWWNYCQWVVDAQANAAVDPQRWLYIGDKVNADWNNITNDAYCGAAHKLDSTVAGTDVWANPQLAAGTYRFTFDAHLGRATLVALPAQTTEPAEP